MSSAICFNLDQAKILSSGYGLNNVKTTSTSMQSYKKYFRENCQVLISFKGNNHE